MRLKVSSTKRSMNVQFKPLWHVSVVSVGEPLALSSCLLAPSIRFDLMMGGEDPRFSIGGCDRRRNITPPFLRIVA